MLRQSFFSDTRPAVDPAKVLLLDRDGVLNVDRATAVLTTAELELLPGVGPSLATLERAGWTTVVITNQSCVGRGRISEQELTEIHRELTARIAADGGRLEEFLVCPHVPADACDCRKPSPGLIVEAQKSYGFTPSSTWMVGDDLRDCIAAQAAGCKPALVRTGKGASFAPRAGSVPVFDDLAAFVRALLPQ